MNYQHAYELLATLVNIDSESQNVLGVKKVQDIIAELLTQLQMEIVWIKSPLDPNIELLWAKSTGIKAQEFTFICHADTALPLQQKYDEIGDKILGTGIADNKGGVVVGLVALEKFLKNNLGIFPVNFIVSPNEETGSSGFHKFLNDIGKKSIAIFGLEPALLQGDLIASRSGNRWYNVVVDGIGAHSGRINIPKLNSFHETMLKIYGLQQDFSRYSEIRFNITSAQTSSDAFNIIPERTKLKMDLRFESNDWRDFAHEKILHEILLSHLQCLTTGERAKCQIEIQDDCPAMEKSSAFDDLYEIAKFTLNSKTTKDFKVGHSFGAGDINHLYHKDAFAIDGLGVVGGGMHRSDEYILKHSLVEKSLFLYQFLLEVKEYFEVYPNSWSRDVQPNTDSHII